MTSEPTAQVMGGTNGGPYFAIEEFGREIGSKLLNGEITSEEAVESRKEELKEEYEGGQVEKNGSVWEVYI